MEVISVQQCTICSLNSIKEINHLRKKGTIVTNGKMWGYDQVNANFVINEKEARIVRSVFNAYIQGKGFRTISNELEGME